MVLVAPSFSSSVKRAQASLACLSSVSSRPPLRIDVQEIHTTSLHHDLTSRHSRPHQNAWAQSVASARHVVSRHFALSNVVFCWCAAEAAPSGPFRVPLLQILSSRSGTWATTYGPHRYFYVADWCARRRVCYIADTVTTGLQWH